MQIANFMSGCQCSQALNLYDKYSSEVLASLKSSLNPFLILIKKCQVQVQNTNMKYFLQVEFDVHVVTLCSSVMFLFLHLWLQFVSIIHHLPLSQGKNHSSSCELLIYFL